MGEAKLPEDALALLGWVYRRRASGLLLIGPLDERVRVAMREGQIVALGPIAPPSPPPTSPRPRPDDSVAIRLQKVLVDIGLRKEKAAPPPAEPPAPALDLRSRLLSALLDRDTPAEFVADLENPDDVAPIAGATEPLILEAVKRLPAGAEVRNALGDLEQRVVATTALAEERTLTLTEGYLLSRIDGQSSAHEVLQLVPLDPDETERTLLGLLLTGRVEYRPAPARPAPAPEPTAPPTEAAAPAEAPTEPEPESVADSVVPIEAEEEAVAAPVPAVPEMDNETLEQRREIVELFQSLPLKNHFEVLGVEPGCSDADVKRAHTALAKRFHPDVHRDPRLEDLGDILEAIFIRIGEAWEVLGSARSRAAYEARFGTPARPAPARESEASQPSAAASGSVGAPSAAPATASQDPAPYVMPEETLSRASLLLAQARYWDAIQILEASVPHMQPQRHQHRARILLARAYAKNPNWLRQAQDQLKEVVREDPDNADALYELGLVYKAGGLTSRAHSMSRRAIEARPDHREAAAELGAPQPARSRGLLKKLFKRGPAS
jgi:curved DNA-binding protein CbpA